MCTPYKKYWCHQKHHENDFEFLDSMFPNSCNTIISIYNVNDILSMIKCTINKINWNFLLFLQDFMFFENNTKKDDKMVSCLVWISLGWSDSLAYYLYNNSTSISNDIYHYTNFMSQQNSCMNQCTSMLLQQLLYLPAYIIVRE